MKKVIIILLILIIVSVGVIIYFRETAKKVNNESQDLTEIMNLVHNFGLALKDVSLLAPNAAEEIGEKYRDFLTPDLLSKWEASPSEALGRVTSSPWPERIEVNDIEKASDTEYLLKGSIIEMTSVEETQGGNAGKQEITINVQKINDKWLICSVLSDQQGS
jgi:hypothetical protein